VGAGPGDPGPLTPRAAKAIESADAALFDALIDPAILDLAGSDVMPSDRRISGSAGGRLAT
jgi:uroporphyrin-III C-methyltransferase